MPDEIALTRTHINPRKLLLSKWTAVAPQAREKHFMVVRLIDPALPELPVEVVERTLRFQGYPLKQRLALLAVTAEELRQRNVDAA